VLNKTTFNSWSLQCCLHHRMILLAILCFRNQADRSNKYQLYSTKNQKKVAFEIYFSYKCLVYACTPFTYNLGQNKIRHKTTPPPNQCWTRATTKTRYFFHHWNGVRGGLNVSFVLSKIVGFDLLTMSKQCSYCRWLRVTIQDKVW